MRRLLAALALAAALSGCETLDSGTASSILNAMQGGTPLSMETIVAGLKEALEVGTNRTVAQVSQTGGYAQVPELRIPLPPQLQGMAATMRKVGLGGQVDLFEAKMNEAAEKAALQAAPVFVDAIKQMSFDDARRILDGGDHAATDYFQGKTMDRLSTLYAPVVSQKLQEVGAVRVYDDMMARYRLIPLVPKPEFEPSQYVTDEALTGLFSVLADQEKQIRDNPAARTTELLKQVFGSR